MDYSKMVSNGEILLVEDNQADVDLTIEAFQETNGAKNLHVVRDGEAALEFLRRQGKYQSAPHPHLILLDLNLPKMDGREFLAELKNDPNLKHIPVVVLSSSASEQDVLKCYQLHANCYITKPVNFEQFVEVIKTVENFFLNLVQLPSQRDI